MTALVTAEPPKLKPPALDVPGVSLLAAAEGTAALDKVMALVAGAGVDAAAEIAGPGARLAPMRRVSAGGCSRAGSTDASIKGPAWGVSPFLVNIDFSVTNEVVLCAAGESRTELRQALRGAVARGTGRDCVSGGVSSMSRVRAQFYY